MKRNKKKKGEKKSLKMTKYFYKTKTHPITSISTVFANELLFNGQLSVVEIWGKHYNYFCSCCGINIESQESTCVKKPYSTQTEDYQKYF